MVNKATQVVLAIQISLFVISPDVDAEPAVEWERAFGGSYDDRGYSVQQTTDGGYVIAGETESFGSGWNDVYLIKTDAAGNKIWEKTFGGGYDDWANSVQLTSDSGFIIAGGTSSFGSDDVYLIKTDSEGNMQWERAFGGSHFEWANSIQQTANGGFIIVGETCSFGAGSYDVYLIKTDAAGNKIWEKTFGGDQVDAGYSLQETTDGGYIITGSTSSYSDSNTDVYLIKTDAAGNKIWEKIFGGSYDSWANSIQQTIDGGYIITGCAYPFSEGEGSVYLLKTDSEGNMQWERTFGGWEYGVGRSVQQTTDRGFIITGEIFSIDIYSDNVYLLKTDSIGNLQWQKTFGGSDWDGGTSVQQTADGGYIIAGETWSYSESSCDVYLIKVSSETSYITSEQPQLKAPWRGTARISQGNNASYSHNRCYMREYDPYNCAWENTYAIDVPLTVGSDILAPAAGTVFWYDDDPSGAGGKELVIQHIGPAGKEFYTVYLHLDAIVVKSGSVKQGQLIAKSGATGGVPPHLHFHIWDTGVGNYDSHTLPIERLVLKQIGVDTEFREYDGRKGELDDANIAGEYFESNNALSAIKITAYSPVDLAVTDPEGFIVTKQLKEIPGATYIEYDTDGDGEIEDIIDISKRAIGNYLIEVIPEPNTLPVDTYSLTLETGDTSTILADNVSIQDIPIQPYEFESKLNFSDFDSSGIVDLVDLAFLSLFWLSKDCEYPEWCEGTDLNHDEVVDFTDFTLFGNNWLWEKNPADIDINGKVNFGDYVIFASYWLEYNCIEPNWCSGTDLDKSGQVDILDLQIFSGYWMDDTIP